MSKTLIVVESPAKAKTIGKILGSNYLIKASMGHIKDLPKKSLGIDIKDDFAPEYKEMPGKKKVIQELKSAAQKVETVLLALDPDREGEAIAYHVKEIIQKQNKKIFRILFNEITKKAIQNAVKIRGNIDMAKVNAQQARRVLDRLVGYQVSPLLWRALYPGLSAGRVQSVALRLISEREAAIKNFKSEEYWSIEALLKKGEHPPFSAKLAKIDNQEAKLNNQPQVDALKIEICKENFIIQKIAKKQRLKYPAPPFITSTLQQESSRKLYFSANKTMVLAQQLYEGIEVGEEGPLGLITYMRTDSTRIAMEALTAGRDYILQTYGEQYLPDKPNFYQKSKTAQDAHEAIRPTSLNLPPAKVKNFLTKDLLKVYALIWNRFISSQMTPAVYDSTTVDILAGRFLFRASGSVLKFSGFQQIYRESQEDTTETDEGEIRFPELNEGDRLQLSDLTGKQHFTEPAPRYSEASLVKELETLGIGRPSTYAQIIDTLRKRTYVQIENHRFQVTELGKTVNQVLINFFPNIFTVEFTAHMETDLDSIEEGRDQWNKVIARFYGPFENTLNQVKGETTQLKKQLQEKTDLLCELCGKPLVIKWGRNGKFIACSGFPECKNTKPLPGENSEILPDVKCKTCGAPMIVKRWKRGRFMGCSRYPDCKYTESIPLDVLCPENCGGHLSERYTRFGKIFYGCSSYPNCKFALWNKPINRECPSCHNKFMVEKSTKKEGNYLYCPSCKNKLFQEPVEEKTPSLVGLPE